MKISSVMIAVEIIMARNQNMIMKKSKGKITQFLTEWLNLTGLLSWIPLIHLITLFPLLLRLTMMPVS